MKKLTFGQLNYFNRQKNKVLGGDGIFNAMLSLKNGGQISIRNYQILFSYIKDESTNHEILNYTIYIRFIQMIFKVQEQSNPKVNFQWKVQSFEDTQGISQITKLCKLLLDC